MQFDALLAEVDSLKAEIDKLRPLKSEDEQRIMRKFRLDWNYHSNAIEGNTLTLGETKAFLTEGLTANGKPLKDHLDIKGHDDLITFLQSYIQQKVSLTESDIRGMHQILLKESYETDAFTNDGKIIKRKVRLGEYKTEPNAVRMASGEIHQYTAPHDVGFKMAELINRQRKAEIEGLMHPVEQAARLHYNFVAIHPFDDGNGRMARILMNLVLMRAGFPPVIIKLKDRDPYIATLRRADVGEMDGIITLICQNLLDSENLYLRGAKGESVEDIDDVDKEVVLLKQELKNLPVPATLTPDIQQIHFNKELIPFLTRLDAKLIQFDEMFEKSYCVLSGQTTTVGAPESLFNFPGVPAPRSRIISDLSTIDGLKRRVLNYQFSFRWDGFLGDGPNDFSIFFQLNISYQERKMALSCDNPRFSHVRMYQDWFGEEEIKEMLRILAKHCLDSIKQSRSKKN